MTECLHTPFFAAALRHPDRMAVVDAERRLNYAQLAHRARLAAAHLEAAGVGRGDRVAVLLDRSAVTMAVWLGILSLGAVAVPFDMRWPMARRRRLLEGLDLRAVVLEQPATPEVSAIPLRFTPAWLASPIAARTTTPTDAGTPEAAEAADNLACIFFTAGTHGPPKGVCVTHRATRDVVDWLVQETGLQPNDRVAALTAFTAEQSLFDLFATLSAGATVVLLSQALMAQPRQLADMLEREAITALYTVPTVLSLLAGRGDLARRRLTGLRLLISSGEPFAGPAFAALQQAVPASVLHLHAYSTAETNLCILSRFTGAESPPARLPLGRARPGLALVGLPLESPSLFAPGAVELCVAGPSVMSGYWGDVRDLAPHWWDDPSSGLRYFRTGDVVRQDSEALWHHLGRVDRPLLPDGRWVDMSEVELTLLGQPGVAHCAVSAAEPGSAYGGPLVAHIVPRPGQDLAQLKLQLAASCIETLPDHLQPQTYVMRGDLPLKASGRVDRHALELDLRDAAGARTPGEADPSAG
jgi:pyochelin synthetase